MAKNAPRLHARVARAFLPRKDDRIFLATLSVAEGFLVSANVRSGQKVRPNQPRLVIAMRDRTYPAEASKLMGISPLRARVPTRSHGMATRWSAMAYGVRAALVMWRIWGEILEGTRKRRFRDWMPRIAIPHVERVPSGLPRHVVKVEKNLGLCLEELLEELQLWKSENERLPTEEWKMTIRMKRG